MWVKYPSSLFLPSISLENFFDAGTRVASIPYVEELHAIYLPVGMPYGAVMRRFRLWIIRSVDVQYS